MRERHERPRRVSPGERRRQEEFEARERHWSALGDGLLGLAEEEHMENPSPFANVEEPPDLDAVDEPAEDERPVPLVLDETTSTPVRFPIALNGPQGLSPIDVAALVQPSQRVAELVEAVQEALVAPETSRALVQLVAQATTLDVVDAASYQRGCDLYEQLAVNEKGIEDGDIGRVVAFFYRPWKAMTTFRARYLKQVQDAKKRLSDVCGAWRLAENRRAEDQRRKDEQAAAETERERLRQLAATATKNGDKQTAAVVTQMVQEVSAPALPLESAVPATPTKERTAYVVDAVEEDAFYRGLADDPTRRRAAPIDFGYLNRQAKDLGTDVPKRFPGVTVKEKGGLSASGRR